MVVCCAYQEYSSFKPSESLKTLHGQKVPVAGFQVCLCFLAFICLNTTIKYKKNNVWESSQGSWRYLAQSYRINTTNPQKGFFSSCCIWQQFLFKKHFYVFNQNCMSVIYYAFHVLHHVVVLFPQGSFSCVAFNNLSCFHLWFASTRKTDKEYEAINGKQEKLIPCNSIGITF